jgi:hypothetical protein
MIRKPNNITITIDYEEKDGFVSENNWCYYGYATADYKYNFDGDYELDSAITIDVDYAIDSNDNEVHDIKPIDFPQDYLLYMQSMLDKEAAKVYPEDYWCPEPEEE